MGNSYWKGSVVYCRTSQTVFAHQLMDWYCQTVQQTHVPESACPHHHHHHHIYFRLPERPQKPIELATSLGMVSSLSSSFCSSTLSWLGISNNGFIITVYDRSQNLNFLVLQLWDKNLSRILVPLVGWLTSDIRPVHSSILFSRQLIKITSKHN